MDNIKLTYNLTNGDNYIYTANFNEDSMGYSISKLRVSDYIDESVNKIRDLEEKVKTLEEKLMWLEGKYLSLNYSVMDEVKKVINNMSLEYVKKNITV